MTKVKEGHVEWVSYSPFWWMDNRTSSNIYRVPELVVGAGFTISDKDLIYLFTKLKSHGFKTVLKPGLNVLDSPGWIGNMQPDDWETWFADYKTFITHYARLADSLNVDMFLVGGELYNAYDFKKNWVEIIKEVRQIYRGKISIQAGSVFLGICNIDFWDKLDYIGFSYYYPGSGDPFNHSDGIYDPTIIDMVQNFVIGFHKQAYDLYQTYNRPLIIFETGCPNFNGANRAPDRVVPGEITTLDNKEQWDYYEAMLRFTSNSSIVAGQFFFVYPLMSDYGFQEGEIPYGHAIQNRPVWDVIKLWYKQE